MNRKLSVTAVLAAALLLTACGTEIERESSVYITTRETEASETTETIVLTAASTTDPDATAPPPADAAAVNISWRNLFAQKLRDYASTAGYIPASMNPDSHSRYGITDLDGNGLPELLIAYNADENTVCTVYYITADGQVLVAGELGAEGCFELDVNRRLAVVRSSDETGSRYMSYRFAGNALVPEMTMTDSLGEALFPPAEEQPAETTAPAAEGDPAQTAEPKPEYGADAFYSINDNTVTREEYLAYYNDYWANATLTKVGGLIDFDSTITPEKLVW